KHIVFRARSGWWQVEEQAVRADLRALDACLTHIAALYRVFSKAEIATGVYSPGRMMQYSQAYGLDDYLAQETALRQWRGAPYFDLALYLVQKEENDDDHESGAVPGAVSSGAEAADPPLAGAEREVQAGIRAQHLGAVREQHPGRSLHRQPEQVLQLPLCQAGDQLDGG